MKKLLLISAFIFISLCTKAQQDTQVSQYVFNGVYINPAYAGYKNDLFVQSYFRSQWVGVTGAPQSFSIAADGAFGETGNIGLGFTLNNDQIGAQNALSGYFNYAYKIRIGDDETSKLAFGLAAGILQLGIDGSKLNAIQQGDQAIPIASQSTLIPDANFGAYYSNKNYFVGLSATNVAATYIYKNKSSNMLVPIPQPHIYFTGGILIPLNNYTIIKPVFLLKDDLKGPTTLDIDAFLLMNERISIGGFYRTSVKLYQKNNLQNNLPNQNAFGAIVEFFATPNIRIGYSYDQSLNSLSAYNFGTHELSVGFYLNSSKYGNNGLQRCYQF